MDPFSLSAGAVTFIGASVTITKAILGLVASVKAFQSDLKALTYHLNELLRLFTSLQKLQESISNCPDDAVRHAGISPMFAQVCRQDLIRLQGILDELQTGLQGNIFRRMSARVAWTARKSSKIDPYVTLIENHKATLAFALNVFQSFGTVSITTQLNRTATTATETLAISSSTHENVIELKDSANSASHDLAVLTTTVTETSSGVEGIKQSLTTTNDGLDSIKESIATIDISIQNFVTPKDNSRIYKNCHIIPYPRNQRFFGRADILNQMEGELLYMEDIKAGLRSFALHGMPGVGKTQIALQFIHQTQSKFDVVLWVSGSDIEKLSQSFVNIARLIGLDSGTVSADQCKSINLVQDWFRSTYASCLLILDNVDDLSIIGPYWPCAGNGSIIITSQNPACEYTFARRGISILPFTPDESYQFFHTRLPYKLSAQDNKSASQIIDSLGCHPLAINQIASFIIESKCSIQTIKEMHAQRMDALKLQQIECGSPWYSKTVAAAFELSIDKLTANAEMLLLVLSFFDPDLIPEKLLLDDDKRIEEFSTPLKLHIIIKDLRKFSLIDKNPEKETISIHRLVRDAALRRLDCGEEQRQTAFANATHLLRQAFPLHGLSRDHMTEVWDRCEKYLAHVLALHDRYVDLKDHGSVLVGYEFIELIYSCAWYLCERGRFDRSAPLIETAIACRQLANLQDHGLIWADICTLQLFQQNETSQPQKLIQLASEALEIRESAVKDGYLDKSHPNRANSFMNLGVIYGRSDPREAIRLHKIALDIRKGSTKYLENQIHGLALNYLNIGRCFWMVGELQEASDAFENVLSVLKEREEALNIRFPVCAWALQALGNVRTDQGKLDAAFILHAQSMGLLQDILGPGHLKTGACYYRVAWFLHKRGEALRSINLLRLALKIYADTKAVDVRAEIARTKYKLAQVLKDTNEHVNEEWQVLMKEAQILRQELVGTLPEDDDNEESYEALIAYFYR